MSIEELWEIYDQLEDFLVIDRNALEVEFANQPELYKKAAGALAKATSIRDRLEYEITKEEARLSVKFRLDAGKEGGKLSDKKIEMLVELEPSIISLNENYLKAKDLTNHLLGTMQAFSQRKDMLEWEGRLYLSSYYGNLEIKDEKGIVQDKYRKAREKLRQGD